MPRIILLSAPVVAAGRVPSRDRIADQLQIQLVAGTALTITHGV
jgi:hypothetical protein